MQRALRPLLDNKELFGKTLQDHVLTKNGRQYMIAVLEFLSVSQEDTASTDLVLNGWLICHIILPHDTGVFVENGGPALAIRALEHYHQTVSILQNISKILCSVAAGSPQELLKHDNVEDLVRMSQSSVQLISYISCRVLACLLFKHQGKWCLEQPTHGDVVVNIRRAISNWNVDTEMGIEIRSMDQLREYMVSYQPALQHLAVWDIGYTYMHTVYQLLSIDLIFNFHIFVLQMKYNTTKLTSYTLLKFVLKYWVVNSII